MLKEAKSTQGGTFSYQRLSKEEMERRGILGRLVGICADFINPTRNGRKYSEQLWENVFESDIMKEKIANHVCYGELNHPVDREEIDMEKIAVCLAEQPMKNDSGKLCAVFDILDTPNGRLLKTLCDYGSTVGISSRGTGDLYTDENGDEAVDPNTYNCECFDVVLIPAVKEARLSYVTESLDKKRYNKTLRQKLSEDLSKATVEDRKIMAETLDELDIQLEEEVLSESKFDSYDDQFKVMLLGRLISDCKYFLGAGNRHEKHLWSGDVTSHINDMRELYNSISQELLPAWITEEEIDRLASEMLEENSNDELASLVGEKIRLVTKDHLHEYLGTIESVEDGYLNLNVDGEIVKIDIDTIAKFKVTDATEMDGYFDEEEKEFWSKNIISKNGGTEPREELEEECNNESCADTEVSEETDVVDDEFDIIAELQEMLLKNRKLVDDNLSLQEQLSVCRAKEIQLEEDLRKYKTATANLSESAKNSKRLMKRVKSLHEQLSSKTALSQAINKEYKMLTESYSHAEASLENSQTQVSQLENQLDALTRRLEDVTQNLNEALSLNKKYQVALKEAKNRYVESAAYANGISVHDIKSKLNESYSYKDVDSVCKELVEQHRNLSKLPFQLTESTKIKVQQSKNEYIKGDSINSDDDVSDSLLRMIGL